MTETVSVSYTHLDVYKRQILPFGRRRNPGSHIGNPRLEKAVPAGTLNAPLWQNVF